VIFNIKTTMNFEDIETPVEETPEEETPEEETAGGESTE